jgi:sRNA-binding carbon storage regulator CsrA
MQGRIVVARSKIYKRVRSEATEYFEGEPRGPDWPSGLMQGRIVVARSKIYKRVRSEATEYFEESREARIGRAA